MSKSLNATHLTNRPSFILIKLFNEPPKKLKLFALYNLNIHQILTIISIQTSLDPQLANFFTF